MDVTNSRGLGGSLQISTEVLAKIAKMATLEIEGVAYIASSAGGVRSLFRHTPLLKPISVVLTDDVAEVTVTVAVQYGCKIPALCERIQENVKSSIQNMTNITVSRVHVVIAEVAQEPSVTE